MRDSQKFLFETSFEVAVGEPEPKFSEQDLAAAREAAFDAGRQAGHQDAAEGEERRIAELMTLAVGRIDALKSELDGQAARITRDAVDAAMTISRKVLPTLARRNALGEVEGMFAECLNIIREEPRVVVRVPGDLAESLQGRLEQLAAGNGFHGKLVFMPDDDLAPTDCAVIWADGGANRDLARTWAEIDQSLNRFLYAAGTGDDTDEPSMTGDTPE